MATLSSFQAVLCTWEWWSERSSGEECLTKWAVDNASSSACPRMASLPSCHLSSRDMASSSFAVSSRVSGESDKPEVNLTLTSSSVNCCTMPPQWEGNTASPTIKDKSLFFLIVPILWKVMKKIRLIIIINKIVIAVIKIITFFYQNYGQCNSSLCQQTFILTVNLGIPAMH